LRCVARTTERLTAELRARLNDSKPELLELTAQLTRIERGRHDSGGTRRRADERGALDVPDRGAHDSGMHRRRFLASSLAGAVAAPLAGAAQQAGKVYRIGFVLRPPV
jgi:hypothetical protein